MADDFTTSWIGSGLRHVNALSDRDILDFQFVGSKRGNRWNEPGDPTLYLAGDPGVLITEWGRHLQDYGETVTTKRDVYRLHMSIKSLIDLRSADVRKAYAFGLGPETMTNVELAQSIANRVRRTTTAQAMLVPSIAFLDDLTRWNLVVFLDKMPRSTDTWITRVERIGPLAWAPD